MPRQTDLRYTFESADESAFEVVAFRLSEGLSEPYLLEVELSSDNAAVDFGKVLDQPALFTIWRGETAVRRVHGVVSGFSQGTTGFRRTRYQAIVEPLLARAGLRSGWRIFQQRSVPEILQGMIKEQRITAYAQHLAEPHLAREYCVQANETDLDFLARLAAEEGLLYGFTHDDKSHTLIHVDRVQSLGDIEGDAVVYEPMPGGDQAKPGLRQFRYTEQVRTAQQTQRDYTFKNPRYGQEHNDEGRELEHQHDGYERYDYPGRYKQDAAGKPFTKTRLQALRRDARVAHIEGDDARIEPGKAFELTGHPRDDWNTRWRAVRVTHQGHQATSQQEEAAGSEQGTSYSQQAEVIPAFAEWKAPLCAKPRIDGPQMATVTGPEGEEIHCDQWGRITVQFPWDREGAHDEHSSCWIRVAQNWAGAAWGHMAVPRIGQEVIVDFLDGDPDQPIVTGRTYHAANLPPYELPAHKTRMTIKSQTHKGEGYNELRFEDEREREEIYVHAQKDQNIHINNNETISIGNDRSEQIENDETIGIGHDRKETVGHDESVTVDHDRRHDIGQDAYRSIGRLQTIQIGKDRIEEVGNHRQEKTAVNHWIQTGGNVEHKVQGRHSIEAGQRIEEQTRQFTVSASQELRLAGPGGMVLIDASGITITGLGINLKGPLGTISSGSGNNIAVSGTPAPGEPICVACMLKAIAEGRSVVKLEGGTT